MKGRARRWLESVHWSVSLTNWRKRPVDVSHSVRQTQEAGELVSQARCTHPKNGMMVYCRNTPATTALGICSTELNWLSGVVSPMPSMVRDSVRVTSSPWNQLTSSGLCSATTAPAATCRQTSHSSTPVSCRPSAVCERVVKCVRAGRVAHSETHEWILPIDAVALLCSFWGVRRRHYLALPAWHDDSLCLHTE
jgi:hypothetical protein